MATIKSLYPATSSVPITLTAASLASDSTLLAGRASTAVDNTTNLDLDHMVSGSIVAGTSPSGGVIEVWAWAPRKTVSGTPTYPDSITGTDAAKTMTSANVKYASLRLVASIQVDTTSSRVYDFAPVSVCSLFGSMPRLWGLFITQSTGVALNASGHEFHCDRVQGQAV